MSTVYTLIRSSRRTLAIQIDANGNLIARAPLRMSVGSIEGFILAKRDWIEKKVKNIESKVPRIQYTEPEIQNMKKVLRAYIIPRVHSLWEGKNLPKISSIKITKSERRWGSCSAKNGLCFSYRLAEWLSGSPVKGGLRGVWNQETKPPCPIGHPPFTGGHSTDFIDAIIIHELAHLREKNHQKSFWNLVYSWMPNYEEVTKNRDI